MPIQLGDKKKSLAEFDRERVALALSTLDNDLADLTNATLADTKLIIRRLLLRQRAMIKALEYIAKDLG